MGFKISTNIEFTADHCYIFS